MCEHPQTPTFQMKTFSLKHLGLQAEAKSLNDVDQTSVQSVHTVSHFIFSMGSNPWLPRCFTWSFSWLQLQIWEKEFYKILTIFFVVIFISMCSFEICLCSTMYGFLIVPLWKNKVRWNHVFEVSPLEIKHWKIPATSLKMDGFQS